jgi:hypothetical protein
MWGISYNSVCARRVMTLPFILHIMSYAPTIILFLHIQGCVPYCRVIPTRIAMSHTVVLNLHIKSYSPYCSIYVGNKLQLWMCKDDIKVGVITLYVEV